MRKKTINYGKVVIASIMLLALSGVVACSKNGSTDAKIDKDKEVVDVVANNYRYGQRSADSILKETCGTCHSSEKLGRGSVVTGADFSRIRGQRKTPEGWLMTIARMQVAHGVQISEEDRRTLVKHLSDTQGMAPSETKDYRYALERRLNSVEEFRDPESDLAELGEMCARCHSGARFALQRRDQSEWEHTIHMHLGQWPSLEYQALSRDRDWFDIALKDTVPELAERFGLESSEWDAWKAERPDSQEFEGEWSFSGHYPGKGSLHGVMTATYDGNDTFKLAVKGKYSDGKSFKGSGTALVYNGYEWRGNLEIEGTRMQQVLTVLDGKMEGRMFEKKHFERGLDFVAAHKDTEEVLAIQPSYVKVGEKATLHIVGTNLSKVPNLGKGVKVKKVVEKGPFLYTVDVEVDKNAPTQQTTFGSHNDASFAVYHNIHKLTVTPDFAVARIGGDGGHVEKVEGRFDALAWTKDGDKEILLGAMPATWSAEPFDEDAKENNDLHYSGQLDSATGVFTPAIAGPNKERALSSNNIGNLNIIATVKDGNKDISGTAQLVVGVPVWTITPIP